MERRRPRLRPVVASARWGPESPSSAAEGTSTPPREARVGDPGGCAPWVPKLLAEDFRLSPCRGSRSGKAPGRDVKKIGQAEKRGFHHAKCHPKAVVDAQQHLVFQAP